MGKINMGFFYGKLFNSRNRTFSLENGENFIEGTGPSFLLKIVRASISKVSSRKNYLM